MFARVTASSAGQLAGIQLGHAPRLGVPKHQGVLDPDRLATPIGARAAKGQEWNILLIASAGLGRI